MMNKQTSMRECLISKIILEKEDAPLWGNFAEGITAWCEDESLLENRHMGY